MKILSVVDDRRIHSKNILAECTFKEYLSFARHIKDNNDFQRKRIKTSKTVYSLLKEDLEQGCVIPPIVLAIAIDYDGQEKDDLYEFIIKNKDSVMILDGLQRTYTLIDADNEMKDKESTIYDGFNLNKLRLEIYTDINKFGILYRMLTLNTGQTPMSLRHQLEMLYSNMLNEDIEGVKLVKDTDGKADADENEFVFKNTIDGFNSYLTRSELPIDREELLDNIRILEKMADEPTDEDLFKDYLNCYVNVFNALKTITNSYEINQDDLDEYKVSGNPFGKKATKIFSTSQAMTGFGAAIGKLKDADIIDSFKDVDVIMERLLQLQNGDYEYEWMIMLVRNLDLIRNTSKKIGNAQRMFFQYFFRELLNSESDSYLNLNNAVENAFQKYLSQVA